MSYSFVFFLNSALLGVGLAMDAFSVSLANGLHEPKMRVRKMCGIAGIFGGFQAFMPMAGWLCVHTIVESFRSFEKFIPWIALILLGYIGGSMLINGIRGTGEDEEFSGIGLKALFIQGVATSIDALSVGFTIANYDWLMALVCSVIIAVVTFFICMAGLSLGKRFGTRLSNQSRYFRRRDPDRNRPGDFHQQCTLACVFIIKKLLSVQRERIKAFFNVSPINEL